MRPTWQYLSVSRGGAQGPRPWWLIGVMACLSCLDPTGGRTITQAQFCVEQAAIDCQFFDECYDAARLAAEQAARGVTWADRADCTRKLQAQCVGDRPVCPATAVFQEMLAAACLDAQRVQTCAHRLADPPVIAGACQRCDPGSNECVSSWCGDPD